MATLDYDPASGTVMLVADGGTLTFDGCGAALEFSRQRSDGPEELALWVTSEEAVVLAKMVNYCLTRLPNLTAPSRTVLESIQPRLDALAQTE